MDEIEKVEKVEIDGCVVESMALSRAIFGEVTKKQLDVILYLISLVQKDDKSFKKYVIPFDELCRLYNPANPWREETKELAEAATKSLMRSIFGVRAGKTLKLYHWVEKAEINEETQLVTFALSPEVQRFYIQLKQNYLVYTLRNILELRTLPEARLYQWAYSQKGFGVTTIAIDDLKELMCGTVEEPPKKSRKKVVEPVEKKKVRTTDFLRFTLRPAVERINEKTDLHLEFDLIRADRSYKTKVTSIRFHIFCNYRGQAEEEKIMAYRTMERAEAKRAANRKYYAKLYDERQEMKHKIEMVEDKLGEAITPESVEKIKVDSGNKSGLN